MLYDFIVLTFKINHNFFFIHYDLLFCIIILIDSILLKINHFVANHFKNLIFIEKDSTHRIKMSLHTIFIMICNIKLVLLKIL